MPAGDVWRPYKAHTNLLRRAGQRLDDVHYDESTTVEDALGALTDWMHWVINLDDQFAEIVGRKDYEKSRRINPTTHAVLGVRHAWNLTKHHGCRLESAVQLRPGLTFPVVFPAVFREITWLPFDDLPLPPPQHRYGDLESAYKGYLAGQPVRRMAPAITTLLCEPTLKTDGP